METHKFHSPCPTCSNDAYIPDGGWVEVPDLTMIDDWEERDKAAWNLASRLLVSRGYTRQASRQYVTIFVKDDKKMILVRQLGVLNWHPRRLDE